jgi:outer membrane protein OmpA-like peptidoglycan-associated protein/uncharacterized protein YidB (DUF937 family)
MFDAILETLASRFGMDGQSSRKLLGMLLGLIFNEKNGGAAGFLELFRQKGLGNLVDSWVGNGSNQAITGDQFEHALGGNVIAAMASELGVGSDVVKAAGAGILPDVVNQLTSDGRIPTDTSIPERLMGYVGDVGDWMKDLGGWGLAALGAGAAAVGAGVAAMGRAGEAAAGAVADTVGDAARAVGRVGDAALDTAGDAARAVGRAGGAAVDAAGDAAKAAGRMAGDAVEAGGGLLRKLLPWLLLLGAVAIGLFAMRSCKEQDQAAVPPADVAAPVEQPAAPVVQSNSRFSMDNTADGKVNVSGQVASDADKTKLMDALTAAFGAGNVDGDITVDANSLPAGWMDKLIGLLPDLKASGLKLGFDGDKINIDTSAMPEDQRFALSDKLRGAFGGFEIDGLWDKAMAAFSGLKSGFSADDLIKALNLMNVYFDTGSANITRDSLGTLMKAAEAIKAAPAGTKLEVGGHTDNTGDAAANMTLSQQRADAVVAKLGELGVAAGTLTAKGYGQDKPTADNGTEEGRAKNRRIEFSAMTM